MEAKYLDLLPPPCRDIVERAEAQTGNEISVKPYSADIRREFAALVACNLPILDKTHDAATIWHPPEGIARHLLIHETLHVWRDWLVPVWRLHPANSRDRIVMAVENDIEHLSIIPIEMELDEMSAAYWQSDMLRFIRGAEGLGADFDLLRGWCLVRNIGFGGLAEKACKERLLQRRLFERAEKLADDLRACDGEKIELIRVAVNGLGLRLESFALRQYQIGKGDLNGSLPAEWWRARR